MPWFKLDDAFHSHPKVLEAGNEAVGLYVRCGSYASQHLTDGYIPEAVALLFGSAELADTLVEAKLWTRAKGGWRMHDFLEYNPSREEVIHKRKVRSEAGRKGGVNSGKARAASANARSKDEANRSRLLGYMYEPPSRPVPVLTADVVSLSNGGKARSKTEANGEAFASAAGGLTAAAKEATDSIIEELQNRTGQTVTASWALQVAADILGDRNVADPVAYVRSAIRDNPRRFAPIPQPPPVGEVLSRVNGHTLRTPPRASHARKDS